MLKKKPKPATYEQIVAIVKGMEASPDKKWTVVRYCGSAEPWVLSETLSQRTAGILLNKMNGC